ncbi:tudor domain-containing protein [Caerostris darwini]|uniref:Tudor domain-containing protein n=1 Tax=Caerostris darwini TaxID=1538125 RepID=A0AAV4SI90_9ARAC|nr:tudor domain-containing protein [Caerostris darwini]
MGDWRVGEWAKKASNRKHIKEENENLMEFDWDDTELIKAFDKAMNKCAKKEGKSKAIKKEKRKWKKGDFCRAIFPEDNLLYEAKILSINGDFCTVQFLNYDDVHDVDLCTLKESLGKHVPSSHLDNSAMNLMEFDWDDTELIKAFDKGMNKCAKKEGKCKAIKKRKRMPSHLHIPCPPAVPPMPQSPVFEHNPNLSAMMVSWYMAGYYTGLNASSQNPQCFQHNSGCGRQRCHH